MCCCADHRNWGSADRKVWQKAQEDVRKQGELTTENRGTFNRFQGLRALPAAFIFLPQMPIQRPDVENLRASTWHKWQLAVVV